MSTEPAASSFRTLALATIPLGAMVAGVAYATARMALYVITGYSWTERLIAGALLAAECFILVHGTGYFLQIFHVVRRTGTLTNPGVEPVNLPAPPPVAVVTSCYHEPLAVIEQTLTAFVHLSYPNKHLYFLDDTRYDLPGHDPVKMAEYRAKCDEICKRLGVHVFRRKWHGAKAGMINDFLHFMCGRPLEGSVLIENGREPRPPGGEKYLTVFDADMNPMPDFLEPLISRHEADDKLAFVQTPQYYTNFLNNRVARASGLQQAVFYEYICEGKSLGDAMFCCGTNVVFRRAALEDVGGMDETSVTEDFATSLKFHVRGWRSAYSARVCAFGMGPEDLGGYFKQQFRWALGTCGMLPVLAREFLRGPARLAPIKWWEYFLSSTYYFVGWVFLTMALCPIVYLVFDVPRYLAYPWIYAAFLIPYLGMTLWAFFWTLHRRHYKMKDLFQGQLLISISFPVFIKASLCALAGIRGKFVVTPKGESNELPLTDMGPQIALALLSFAAVVWGANRLYYEREPVVGLVVNMVWAGYHFLILTSVLWFNRTEEAAA